MRWETSLAFLSIIGILFACQGNPLPPAASKQGQLLRIEAQPTVDGLQGGCGDLTVTATNIGQSISSFDLSVNVPEGLSVSVQDSAPALSAQIGGQNLNVGDSPRYGPFNFCVQSGTLPGRYALQVIAELTTGEVVNLPYIIRVETVTLAAFRTDRETTAGSLRIASGLQGNPLGYINSLTNFTTQANFAVLVENNSNENASRITLDVETRQELGLFAPQMSPQDSAWHLQTDVLELRPNESRLFAVSVQSLDTLRPGVYSMQVQGIVPEAEPVRVRQDVAVRPAPSAYQIQATIRAQTGMELSSFVSEPALYRDRLESGRLFVQLQNRAGAIAQCSLEVRSLNNIRFDSAIGWQLNDVNTIAITDMFEVPIDETRVYALDYALLPNALLGDFNLDVMGNCAGEPFQVRQPISIEVAGAGTVIPSENSSSSGENAAQPSGSLCVLTVIVPNVDSVYLRGGRRTVSWF